MEYVNINVKHAKKNNVRYILIMNSSFTETPFKNLSEAFYGYMEKSEAKSGEIYEPTTVKSKVDLTV